MHSPPIVYLDTQDFSRFGDVLRGKSDDSTEAIFASLEKRKLAGEVVFAASMPLLGELLQYNADFRDTTIKKAEAVERLCGKWALAYPSRLLAAEIAELAQRKGLLSVTKNIAILSQDRYWFPNVASELAGLRQRLKDGIDAELSKVVLNSRFQRRRAKKIREIDPAGAARAAAPEMAARYGLPVEAITGSIVSLLRGKISPEEASRRLFGAIAEPAKFVEVYFEMVATDQSALPSWMSKMGTDLEALLGNVRGMILPFTQNESDRIQINSMISDHIQVIGRTVLGMVDDEAEEFGVDAALLGKIKNCHDLVDQLPACEIFGQTVSAYVAQISGLHGSVAKLERSFGGDMVHALYLPHSDLWRGDRRFSQLLRNAVPTYREKIVPSLTVLPHAIDTWRAKHSS